MGIKMFGSKAQPKPDATEEPTAGPIATAVMPDVTTPEPGTPSLLDMEPLTEPALDSAAPEGDNLLSGLAEELSSEPEAEADAPADATADPKDGLDDGLLDVFTDDEEVDEVRIRLAGSLDDVSIDSLLAYTRSILVILRRES